MPISYPPYIFGMHDRGGEHLMLAKNKPGWVLITEGIGADPYNWGGSDYTDVVNKGLTPIVRLNYGYVSDGNIPHSSLYDDFARRCGNFVERSPGCHIWIIGNEMNHPFERPGNNNGQGGEVITPQRYADCYQKCRAEIRRRAGHADDQVVVGAVAPYNVQTTYAGNASGDFQRYLADILALLTHVDGISLHAYTHCSDPALISADTRMRPPYAHLHFDFRVYQDFMAAIPTRFRDRPVYITEADQDHEWLNANNGWVQAAYREINQWNQSATHQPIQALILFRWIGSQSGSAQERGWAIEDKGGVQSDFSAAMDNAYRLVPPRSTATYRAAWLEAAAPTRMDLGAEVRFPVSVRNDGSATWATGGADAVAIGQRWIDAAGNRVEGPRTPLPQAVPPGGTARWPSLAVRAPAKPGFYTLELDLVRGTAGWFAASGSPVQRVEGIQVGKRYEVAWLAVTVPPDGVSGQTITVPVTMRNDGALTWTPLGRDPFNLTYKWLDAQRNVLVADGLRTPLPRDVPPGGQIGLTATVQLPAQTGALILLIDMVHEHVTWFHQKASLPSEHRVDVRPARPDYAAQWLQYTGPQRLGVGEAATAVLRVRNVGAQPWPAGGAQAVSLGQRWLDQQGSVVAQNLSSQVLSQAVAPDATVTFSDALIAPVPSAGTYRLIWDLVQGGRWLSAGGLAVMEVVVQVEAPDYDVAWEVLQAWPAWMVPGAEQRTRLRLRNTGRLPWPAAGSQPVHLAYHWFSPDGQLAEPWDTFRIRLPGDVAPGTAVDLDVPFLTPSVPGRYILRWDLVQEGVTWFFRQGAAPLEVSVEVSDEAMFVRWTAQASHNSAGAGLALDGNSETAWNSVAGQAPGMWFQVDLGEVRVVSRFKAVSPGRGFAVGYQVKLSEDGQTWRLAAAAEQNWRDVDVAFAPTRARYIRLEQTGTPAYSTTWTISEIAVAVADQWAGATTSHNPATAGQALDARLDTSWHTGAVQAPGMWYRLDLGSARAVQRVTLDHPRNQQPRGYVLSLSTDGQRWQEISRKDDNWAMVDVSFPATTARYVRVETTNSSPYHPWGIAEIVAWESAPQWLRPRM